MASKVWPSLKLVYLTTAYFVSQEMIAKLTNEWLFRTESYYFLMLVFCPAMGSLLKENLERLMLCLLIAHCCCFLFLVAKSCWFSGTSSHCLPGNDQNLIILYRSIHPSTCLQSKFCDAFWVYWYKNQVI